MLLVSVFTWSGSPVLWSLDGGFKPVSKPSLTWETWRSGSYQDELELWYKDSLWARPVFVRSHNQIAYSFYGETETYVMIGENDEYYAYNFFPSYRGFDYAGDDHWNEIHDKLNWLQDTLARRGIPMLVVIAPNKVRLRPENLPSNLVNTPGEVTNLSRAREVLHESNIPFIDMNEFFKSKSADTLQLCFANTGMHWNYFGASLAGQRILKECSSLLDTNCMELKLGTGEMKDSTMDGDDELSAHLNLLIKPTTHAQYYPNLRYADETAFRPDVLLIGDSFYWGLKHSGITVNSFSEEQSFWYYNNTNLDSRHGEIAVDSLDRWEELKNRDMIIFLCTESNLDQFPFGLVEDLRGE